MNSPIPSCWKLTLGVLLVSACGACASRQPQGAVGQPSPIVMQPTEATAIERTPQHSPVRAASHQQTDAEVVPPPNLPEPDGPLAEDRVAPALPMGAIPADIAQADPLSLGGVLSLDALVTQVQARNPSIQAASAAWRAAAERYPQVVSLDDPMFGFMKGLDMGYMVESSQRIPWPGKRQLRGRVADSEANAAAHEIGDIELQLAEAASLAYFDYYQAARELEVSLENEELLKAFRDIATAKYESNQTTQQDSYQAEVELALVSARTAEIRRSMAVSAARINTLLHRPADCPLPPPPATLAIPSNLPPADVLRDRAVRHRPDLASRLARIQAEEASVELACKEYYPDMELVYRHDAFMDSPRMYNQIGMNLNVPIYRTKRDAGVREAQARAAQLRAEYHRLVDEAAFEVHAAVRRIDESRSVLSLYETRILPAARANIESARENYVAGRLDFLRLIEAQRQLRDQQERFHQTLAELHRRLAELQRAVGGPVASL